MFLLSWGGGMVTEREGGECSWGASEETSEGVTSRAGPRKEERRFRGSVLLQEGLSVYRF